MTRRQSNNKWSEGIAANRAPIISEWKNPLEYSRLDFFGIKTASSSWFSSKWPNYQRGIFFISTGAIDGHFEGKTLRGVNQGGLVLERQCPGSPGTCNPEETGLPGLPVSWSSNLFSGCGPVGLPPVPWTEKQLKSRNSSSDAEFIANAETWLDGQHSDFFEWHAKVRAMG